MGKRNGNTGWKWWKRGAGTVSRQSDNVLFRQSRNVLLTGPSLEVGRRPVAEPVLFCRLAAGHLRHVLACVKRDPVRTGLVAEAEQYEWSSAAIHLGLVRDRWQLADERIRREQGECGIAGEPFPSAMAPLGL